MIPPQSSIALPRGQPGDTHHHGPRMRGPPQTPGPTTLTTNSSARRNRSSLAQALEAQSPARKQLTIQAYSSTSSVSSSHALRTDPISILYDREQRIQKSEQGRSNILRAGLRYRRSCACILSAVWMPPKQGGLSRGTMYAVGDIVRQTVAENNHQEIDDQLHNQNFLDQISCLVKRKSPPHKVVFSH